MQPAIADTQTKTSAGLVNALVVNRDANPDLGAPRLSPIIGHQRQPGQGLVPVDRENLSGMALAKNRGHGPCIMICWPCRVRGGSGIAWGVFGLQRASEAIVFFYRSVTVRDGRWPRYPCWCWAGGRSGGQDGRWCRRQNGQRLRPARQPLQSVCPIDFSYHPAGSSPRRPPVRRVHPHGSSEPPW